jgi:hypothetical protein
MDPEHRAAALMTPPSPYYFLKDWSPHLCFEISALELLSARCPPAKNLHRRESQLIWITDENQGIPGDLGCKVLIANALTSKAVPSVGEKRGARIVARPTHEMSLAGD